MKNGLKGAWVCLILCAVITALLCILVPLKHTICFWVTLFAQVCALALAAGVLVRDGKLEESVCRIPGWPMSRMVIGVLVMQLLICALLIVFSDCCPWLVAAIVECLVLTVDAAALSVPETDEAEENSVTADAAAPEDDRQ